MSYSKRDLLARLIKCEAGGEGENGMKAVATVVMNRVKSPNGEYFRVGLGDLRNILFQQNQFECLMPRISGDLNPQNIWWSDPEQIHYDIADWALAGNKLHTIDDSLWFFNPPGDNCPSKFPTDASMFKVKLGEHCFYSPNEKYASS